MSGSSRRAFGSRDSAAGPHVMVFGCSSVGSGTLSIHTSGIPPQDIDHHLDLGVHPVKESMHTITTLFINSESVSSGVNSQLFVTHAYLLDPYFVSIISPNIFNIQHLQNLHIGIYYLYMGYLRLHSKFFKNFS